MSGTGRRASTAPAGLTRPDPLAPAGLVVVHLDIDGREIAYDFAALPVAPPMARSLAALFAAKCHPDVWSSHTTSRGIFQQIRSFTAMLAALPVPPRDLDELSAAMVEGWWEQSRSQVLARDSFRNLSSLLRADPRMSDGPVADALSRRVPASRSQVQSFDPDEREAIRTAARAGIRRALLRIEENAAHLDRYRAGVYAAEPDGREAVIGEFLDHLARTGALPHRQSGSVHLPDRYLKALGGGGSGVTWQRLFPSSLEPRRWPWSSRSPSAGISRPSTTCRRRVRSPRLALPVPWCTGWRSPRGGADAGTGSTRRTSPIPVRAAAEG